MRGRRSFKDNDAPFTIMNPAGAANPTQSSPNRSHATGRTSGFGSTSRPPAGYAATVRPLDIQTIGEELAIRWDDGGESFIRLETLRLACPCAGCKGEVDVMGQLHRGPDAQLRPESFQLVRLMHVGGYALQPFWRDGHTSGLFTFDYLRRVAEAAH